MLLPLQHLRTHQQVCTWYQLFLWYNVCMILCFSMWQVLCSLLFHVWVMFFLSVSFKLIPWGNAVVSQNMMFSFHTVRRTYQKRSRRNEMEIERLFLKVLRRPAAPVQPPLSEMRFSFKAWFLPWRDCHSSRRNMSNSQAYSWSQHSGAQCGTHE